MTGAWLLAILIGVVCGLRSFTGPAIVCWGAHLGRLSLGGSPLSFLAHPATLAIFTLLAAGELVADKLPKTPARTTAGPFAARAVLGAICGIALAIAGDASLGLGAFLGILGAVVGTYGGYAYRRVTSGSGKIPDLPVALIEDLVAVGGGLLLVSRF